MYLKELLEGTAVAGDYPQRDICDIVYDSRKAKPGTAFVCICLLYTSPSPRDA